MTRRSASAALLSLPDALALLLDGVVPVAGRARATEAAVGAVCAQDVAGAADVPDRPVAIRDGWAVASSAVSGASPYAPVLPASPPVWVEAGDPLPPGLDTVLLPEAVETTSAGIEIVADAPAGDGTRAGGGEIRRGARMVVAGAQVTPLQALALIAVERSQIEVRIPRIRIVATGGREASSVGTMLAGFIRAEGAEVEAMVAASDEAETIAGAIQAGDPDAVFVVGGTGFGRTDRSAAGLAQAGSLAVHGIAIRPGDTAGFGRANGRAVLLLPGRPEAALSAFLVLGRPLLRALAGRAAGPAWTAPLLRKVSSTIGLSEIVFVRRAPDGIEPLGGAELPLGRLLQADGAILVPPEREGYAEGMMVEVITL